MVSCITLKASLMRNDSDHACDSVVLQTAFIIFTRWAS